MLILHMKQILPKSSQYSAEIPIVCMIWYFIVQLPAVSKRQDVRWCSFRRLIPLSIDDVWNSFTDRAISHHSCSYCIWNRYCQNHRSILPKFLMFAWLDTVEFNRLPCPNNKMKDDMVFADRFRYQFTKFKECTLIGLSRLVGTHIKY